MIYQYYDGLLSPIIATFCWSLGIGLLAYYLVFKTKLFDSLLLVPLAAPFVGIPAVLFAFLMGFMSSDAWQNFSHARTALINEASAVSRLAYVQLKDPQLQKSYRANLISYLEAVLNDEWEKSANGSSSPKAKAALDQLSSAVWGGSNACSTGSKQRGACIDAYTSTILLKAHDDLRNAREQRLSLGYIKSVNTKWLLAILLAFVSAVTVAAVHRSNQKTGLIALVLFCSSIWISLCIVTMFSNPYKWAERLNPVPLSSLLSDLKSITQ